MSQQIPCSHPRFNKAINPEQFEEIVEAILDGKYSWACVLMLRFTGYNPLHYIPYRTYNRLIKGNCQVDSSNPGKAERLKVVGQDTVTKSDSRPSQKGSSKIVDLNYLESVGEKSTRINGGCLEHWLFSGSREDSLLKNKMLSISN